LPTLLIALLALAAVIVFVKREEGSQRKAVDIVSVILNVAICFVFIPFVSVAAMLADLNGGGPEFYLQVLYFLPWFSVMCIAASVALRRKGHGVGSLIAQLAGPAVFVVFLIVCGVCEEL
jgi:Na+/phosphate symporter